MAAPRTAMRPLACWKTIFRQTRACKQQQQRYLATAVEGQPSSTISPPPIDITAKTPHILKKIKTYPPPPTPLKTHKDAISTVTAAQLSLLDPTGARSRLFAKTNPEAAKVGDILLVRQRNGDPFAGVCINIRRQGVDTAILLRGQLTRVGVEMWYKVFSPNVEGIEVVQRREKRARRARLYYMRKPEHDVGSVENIVRQYQRQRAMLGSTNVKGRDANADKKKKGGRGRN